MKKRIVITGSTFPSKYVKQLEAAQFEIVSAPADLTNKQLTEMLDGAWGYVLGGAEKIAAESWTKFESLRAFCFMGTGWRSFIGMPNSKAPIQFTYTPHANADAVAEFALGLLIDGVRRITSRVVSLNRGVWSEESTPSLIGAKLGIIGMGHVGRALARMYTGAFQGEVIYWNRNDREENKKLPYRRVDSISELFKTCDNVAICLAFDPGKTDRLIDKASLENFSATGVLVNVARAELIAPEVLKAFIESHNQGYVALDGYYIEPTPLPEKDPYGILCHSPQRLLVTPHCAYLSQYAVSQMSRMATENLLAIVANKPPPYPIHE